MGLAYPAYNTGGGNLILKVASSCALFKDLIIVLNFPRKYHIWDSEAYHFLVENINFIVR